MTRKNIVFAVVIMLLILTPPVSAGLWSDIWDWFRGIEHDNPDQPEYFRVSDLSRFRQNLPVSRNYTRINPSIEKKERGFYDHLSAAFPCYNPETGEHLTLDECVEFTSTEDGFLVEFATGEACKFDYSLDVGRKARKEGNNKLDLGTEANLSNMRCNAPYEFVGEDYWWNETISVTEESEPVWNDTLQDYAPVRRQVKKIKEHWEYRPIYKIGMWYIDLDPSFYQDGSWDDNSSILWQTTNNGSDVLLTSSEAPVTVFNMPDDYTDINNNGSIYKAGAVGWETVNASSFYTTRGNSIDAATFLFSSDITDTGAIINLTYDFRFNKWNGIRFILISPDGGGDDGVGGAMYSEGDPASTNIFQEVNLADSVQSQPTSNDSGDIWDEPLQHVEWLLYNDSINYYLEDVMIINETYTAFDNFRYLEVSADGPTGTFNHHLVNLRIETIAPVFLAVGNYTSQVFNASFNANWSKIEWSAHLPSNTNISLQYRTSNDASVWSSWSGNVTNGQTELNESSQYFQYRAWLQSFDGASSPYLSDVTVSYFSSLSNPSPAVNSTDGGNFSDEDLNCFYTPLSGEFDSLTCKTDWLKDNVTQFSFSDSCSNGTLYNNVLDSGNTTPQDFWRCQATMNDGTTDSDAINSSEIRIDNYLPTTPNLGPPANNSLIVNDTINLSCSGSTDTDGQTLNYSFYVSLVNPPTAENQSNTSSTLFFNVPGNETYFWRCRAYDGINYSNYTETKAFTVDTSLITGADEGSAKDAVETEYITYEFNVTYNNNSITDINASFTYNNTWYDKGNVTKTAVSDTLFNYKFSLHTPLIDNVTFPPIENKTFAWNITSFYNDGTDSTSNYEYPQLIRGIAVQECYYPYTGCNSSSLNLTFRDEDTDDTLESADLESTLYWYMDSIRHNRTITLNPTGINMSVLLSVSPYGADSREINLQSILKYTNGTSYVWREFYHVNSSINTTDLNSTSPLDLFTLLSANALGVSLTVEDEVGEGVTDRYIFVQKYYPGKDVHRTVAVGFTDENGEEYISLRPYDTFYKFLIYNYTTLVFSSENKKVSSDSLFFTISPGSYSETVANFGDITYSLSNTSTSFVFTFSSINNAIQKYCLRVIKIKAAESKILADECKTTSGTITISHDNDNATYVAQAYAQVNPTKIIDTLTFINAQRNVFQTTLGTDGVFFAFLIIVMVALAMAGSSSAVVVAGTGGVIVSMMLGLLNILRTWEIMIILVVMAGILLVKLKD